jgi:hypothetical protein
MIHFRTYTMYWISSITLNLLRENGGTKCGYDAQLNVLMEALTDGVNLKALHSGHFAAM